MVRRRGRLDSLCIRWKIAVIFAAARAPHAHSAEYLERVRFDAGLVSAHR